MPKTADTPPLQLDIDTLAGDAAKARTMSALFGNDDSPPTSIGGYEVLDVIGRGGVGVVYRAHDTTLDRTVAIKRVRRRTRDGEADTKRKHDPLLDEARQLARVQHDHVVEVFEVGEHEGSPYLVMEYVDGPSLAQWLRSGVHTPQEVRALFVQAGRGLAAAHARDVVHLDFKPANVLVGPGPIAKVADFGLAELFAPSMALLPSKAPRDAVLENIAGTAAYMAPERFSGEVSAKVDQFAFGVSMLEALCGERPFGSASALVLESDEYERRLRVLQSSSASRETLATLRRACARDPDRRWPTLSALLDTLEAEGKRDRRTPLIAAGVVLAAGLGAWVLGGASKPKPCDDVGDALAETWGSSNRARVLEALTTAEVEGADAGARFVIDRVDASARAWTGLRLEVCEAIHSSDAATDTVLDRRAACLEDSKAALTAAVAFALEAPGRVVLQPQALITSLPDLDACRDTDRLREGMPAIPPGDRAAVEQTREALVRVRLLNDLGDLNAAQVALDGAERLAQSTEYQPVHAQLAHRHGSLALSRLDYDRAEEELAQAFVSANALGMADLACEVAQDLAFLFASDMGRSRDEAQRWLEHATSLAERADGTARRRLATTRAAVAQASGDLDAALQSLQDALQASSETDNPLSHAKILNNRGVILRQLGRNEEAEAAVRGGWDLNRKTLSKDHPLALVSEVRLANVLRIQGRTGEALEHARHANAGFAGEDSHHALEASSALGTLLQAVSDSAACDQLRRSVEMAVRLLGPEHPMAAGHRLNLAGCLNHTGQTEDAVEMLRETVRALARAESPNLPIAQHGLADTLLRLAGERAGTQAEQLREEAERASLVSVSATRAARGEDSPLQAGVLEVHARALLELGRASEATHELERTLNLRAEQPPMRAARGRLLLQIARTEAGVPDPDALAEAHRQALAAGPPVSTLWIDAWLQAHDLKEIGDGD